MARVLNLIIVVLEIIAFSKSLKGHGIRKNFISSLLFVIFGGKNYVEVLRFLGVCMLVMTFFVTACILVPMSRDAKGLLFSGSGLFHHLIIPIVSTIGQPWTTYKSDEIIQPGLWNVMPTVTGEHMSLQGGLTKRVNVKPFYLELVEMIASLER